MNHLGIWKEFCNVLKFQCRSRMVLNPNLKNPFRTIVNLILAVICQGDALLTTLITNPPVDFEYLCTIVKKKSELRIYFPWTKLADFT